MARITKASLEEFAKEVAALEAAEATILSTEEMDRYSGGRYGAYTSLGTSQSDHEAHALAGLEHDLLSTEVGMTKEERGGLYTLSSERPSPSENHGISACSYEPASGYFDEFGVFHPTPNPGENPDTSGFVDDDSFAPDPSGGYTGDFSSYDDPSKRDTDLHPHNYTVGGSIPSFSISARSTTAFGLGGSGLFEFAGHCSISGSSLDIGGVANMLDRKQASAGKWAANITIRGGGKSEIIPFQFNSNGSIVAVGSTDLGHAVVNLASYVGWHITVELNVSFMVSTPRGHLSTGVHTNILQGFVSAPKHREKR